MTKVTPRVIPTVRAILEDERNKVLVLKRANTKYEAGKWNLPGGKIDYGISAEEMCRREIREETGLEILDLRFLFYQDSLPSHDADMHCLALYFHGNASGIVRLNKESLDYLWIASKDIDKIEFAFNHGERLRRFFNEFHLSLRRGS